jgi:outer membrane lipopolysaccharide assembly protein LptE/RlpB
MRLATPPRREEASASPRPVGGRSPPPPPLAPGRRPGAAPAPANPLRSLAALAAALALSACGYGFSQRYVARGGASSIRVRPFENRSTDPELGAAIASALRNELARRGADAGGEGAAEIDGEVRAEEPSIASQGGASWRIGVTVRARLVAGGATVAEHVVRRETDYVGGADPLETEGRRALALRRLADDAARDILRAFEG